ncbi:hypothetical protein RB195_011385 [Necator americanus]
MSASQRSSDFVYSREEMMTLRRSKNVMKNIVLPAGAECLYPVGSLSEVSTRKLKSSACRDIARDILLIPSIYERIHLYGTPYLRALVEVQKELRRLEIMAQFMQTTS